MDSSEMVAVNKAPSLSELEFDAKRRNITLHKRIIKEQEVMYSANSKGNEFMMQNPAITSYQIREGIAPVQRMRPIKLSGGTKREGGTKFDKPRW